MVSGSTGVDSIGDGSLAGGAIRLWCSCGGSPSSKGTISFLRPSSMSIVRWKGNMGPVLMGAAVLFLGDSDRARARLPVAGGHSLHQIPDPNQTFFRKFVVLQRTYP